MVVQNSIISIQVTFPRISGGTLFCKLSFEVSNNIPLIVLAPLIDKMVTVSEEWIAISILRLVEMEKAVVEGGGATGVAAVLAGLLPELTGKK